MSNIDKRAQKELYAKVERQAHSLRGSPREYQALTGLCPVNVIEMHAQKIQALLDELESKDAQIANLTAERDALREGEMGDAKHSNTRAAADIYFQLVEECEIPPGGSLVEYVIDLRERAAMLQGAESAESPTTIHTAPELDSSPKIAESPSGNSPVIPDGWVLVPVEPTYQMCEAIGLPWESPRFPDRYKAMIAAAPQQEVNP